MIQTKPIDDYNFYYITQISIIFFWNYYIIVKYKINLISIYNILEISAQFARRVLIKGLSQKRNSYFPK